MTCENGAGLARSRLARLVFKAVLYKWIRLCKGKSESFYDERRVKKAWQAARPLRAKARHYMPMA